MNIELIIEIVGFISSSIIGAVCMKASKASARYSVLLFWVGVTFFFISIIRILSTFHLFGTAESRLIIGLFYPFILAVILIDSGKLP